ncbi:MAG: ATP phosphoribosyltransferase regulatory subunit [Anaeroplasma sp.]
MKNYKLHTSEGFKDTFGEELLVKKQVENITLKLFQSFGYEFIKTPTVEYIDVYSNDGLQKPDLYSLINRQGEVLALCNDMTSSIARFVVSNNYNIDNALKFCYIADTFRYPKLYQGKNHQFLQAGIELIGDKKITSDAEVIYLAYNILKECNVNKFTIHIGSAEFIETILDDLNIQNKVKDAIYNCIKNKDYVTLKQVLNASINEDKANFIVDLMLRGGRLHYLEGLMDKLVNTKSYKILESLKEIYNLLNSLGVNNIIFDFSIYSYADYYTGIVFSVYLEGVSKVVIEGGRCDSLFKNFGYDIPDVGFGLDIDALTDYVLMNNAIRIKEKKYISYTDDNSYIYAFNENNKLRNSNIIVNNINFNNLADAINYAKANGYNGVIEYKNNEQKIWEVELC